MAARGPGGGTNLGSAYGEIILSGDKAKQAAAQVAAALHGLSGPSNAANSALASIQRQMDGLSRTAATMQRAVVAAVSAIGVEKAVGGTVRAAGDLEQAIRNVMSIRPDADFNRTFATLTDLSTQVPSDAKALADGLYNIFSSIEVSFDGAVTLLEQFARGAAAARTDAESFGAAILGVMNAYKLSVADAQHVQDVFFNTVNRGVVTGRELAQNLGVVTASAKTAGVTIEELGAAIAGVTKEGGPAAQNINNLANLFNKIVTADAVKELRALGVATSDAKGNIRPIFDVLKDLDAALKRIPSEAKRAQALQEIFPDAQARQGAVVLMSQLQNVREYLKENQTLAGSAKRAFVTMTDSLNAAGAILRNTWNALILDIGARVLPTVTSAVRALTGVLAGLRATLPDIGGAFSQAFGRIAGLGTDLGLFQGVLNRIFGQGSPIVAGVVTFVNALGNLRAGAAENLTHFAQAVGLAEQPLIRFIAGITELGRMVARRLFPADLDEEIKTVGRGIDQLRSSAEKNRDSLQRFVAGLADIGRNIRAAPEVQRLADAVGKLGEAARRAFEAFGRFIGVFTRPFLAGGQASGISSMAGSLDRLSTPAANAERVLTLLRRAVDGIASIIATVAGGMSQLATSLSAVSQQVAASKVVDTFRVALENAHRAAGPLLTSLGRIAQSFATGFAPRREPIRDTGEAFDTVARAAQDAEAANAAAGVLIATIEALTKASASFAEAMTVLDRQLVLFDESLRATGGGQHFITELDALGAAILRLGGAPFAGIQRSFEDLSRSFTEATGIKTAVGALDVLRAAITVIRLQFEAFAEVIERTTFFLGKHLAALTRLAQGDVAGAIVELGSAMQAFRVVEGPALDANKIIDGPSFDRMRDQITKTGTDITNKLQEIGNWAFPALVPPTIEITANNRQALDQLDQVTRHVAGLPRTANITVYADTSPAVFKITELSRMLPHSPAEIGPLAFEPDWSYLTANLPATLQTMIDLVRTAGKEIGGEKQIEYFRGVADALSAAANALSATVSGLGAAAAFVRPSVAVMDELGAAMVDVVRRFNVLSGILNEKQAEAIQRLGQAASTALGALGTAIESLTKARDFTGPNVTQVQDVIDHMAGVLVRLNELGQGFAPNDLARVSAVGQAAASAMAGLGAAIDPLLQLRSFTGPAVGQVVDVVNHISGVMVRLNELGEAFPQAQIARAEALGSAVTAAMGGLAEAVTALDGVRSFTGFDPGALDGVFVLLSNVAVRFRDLALAFTGRQTEQARETAEAIRASFQALGEALAVIPRIAETEIPDVDAALQRVEAIIAQTLAGVYRIARQLGPEATKQAGEFADQAAKVVGLLGQGADAFAQLVDFQDVSQASIERFGVAVVRSVTELSRVSQQVAKLLTKEAVQFSESASKALGVLGQAASLQGLNEFVAPSRAKFAQFFAALSVAVDGLVAEAKRIAPDIARRTGQVGEDLGKAMGAIGTALSAFTQLQDFKPGKNFEGQIAGVLHFLRLTVQQMQALAASFGDLRQLTAFAAVVEQVSRALSSFISAATAASEAKGLDQVAAIASAIGSAGGAITLRSEHHVVFSGGFSVEVKGASGVDQQVGAQIAEGTQDRVVAAAVNAVREALLGVAA